MEGWFTVLLFLLQRWRWASKWQLSVKSGNKQTNAGHFCFRWSVIVNLVHKRKKRISSVGLKRKTHFHSSNHTHIYIFFTFYNLFFYGFSVIFMYKGQPTLLKDGHACNSCQYICNSCIQSNQMDTSRVWKTGTQSLISSSRRLLPCTAAQLC